MLTDLDLRIFEYVHHMYYENKSTECLAWEDHISINFRPDEWVFKYYEIAFNRCKRFIENKNIIDVGCEIGSKINWFSGLGAKKYTGVDPNKTHLYYANMVSDIVSDMVDIDCKLIESSAEDLTYSFFDTGFLLSVTQHLKDEKKVIANLTKFCTNLVIDTWVNCRGCGSLSYYVELIEQNNCKVVMLEQIKKDRYLIVATKDKKNMINFWSL